MGVKINIFGNGNELMTAWEWEGSEGMETIIHSRTPLVCSCESEIAATCVLLQSIEQTKQEQPRVAVVRRGRP